MHILNKNELKLVFVIILIITGCRERKCGLYVKEGNTIVYRTCLFPASDFDTELEGVDPRTFVVLPKTKDLGLQFARDKHQVYEKGEVLPGLEPSSFQYLGNGFIRDSDSVHFIGFNKNIGSNIITNASRNSFKVKKMYPYAEDSNYIFYGPRIMDVNNKDQFVTISTNWAKTDSFYYFEGFKLGKADYNSFEILGEYKAKDKNGIYESAIELDLCTDSIFSKTYKR